MEFERNEDGTLKLDTNGNPIPKNVNANAAEEAQKQIQAGIDAALAPIKEKLDAAYAQRDALARDKAKLEADRKQAEIEALTAAGKHDEVAAMKVAALEERANRAEARVVELTRNVSVKDALAGLEFRNDRSKEMAYRDVVDQLIQDEKTGEWIHRTGVSLKDFVANFAKDDDNSFLFKPKTNSGSGMGNMNGTSVDNLKGKKLGELTQAQVMQLASEGKLGQFSL